MADEEFTHHWTEAREDTIQSLVSLMEDAYQRFDFDELLSEAKKRFEQYVQEQIELERSAEHDEEEFGRDY